MSRRICLLALSLLLLCTLAVAAPSGPAKGSPATTTAISAPAASPATGTSAGVDSPAGAAATPPWLAHLPAMSVNRPAPRDPRTPVPLDCQGACLQAKNACYAACNDDEGCETGCDNDWWCCSNACRGYFCP